jgi:1-phosphofructokinase/tagatose 6-phosphate kinase
MILTVTLNAAMDRTLGVPSMRLGRRHRAVEHRARAGGKGVNVARALKLLRRPVIATGLAGGPTGGRVLELLAEEGILNDFTRIADESRTNIALVDPTSGEQTEINERGPTVAPEELERYLEKLLYLAQGARLCVIAGSIPPGVDSDVYATLIGELRRLGVSTVLDSYGDPMRAALRAEPAAVTPNIDEAEEIVGHEFESAEDEVMGLNGLIEMGAREAVVTRESGCLAVVGPPESRRRYEVTIEPLEPVATVGSGDAFVAGYVAGLYDGLSARDCLVYGVACGAQATQHMGAGSVDPREVEKLRSKVAVRDLEVPAEVP